MKVNDCVIGQNSLFNTCDKFTQRVGKRNVVLPRVNCIDVSFIIVLCIIEPFS